MLNAFKEPAGPGAGRECEPARGTGADVLKAAGAFALRGQCRAFGVFLE